MRKTLSSFMAVVGLGFATSTSFAQVAVPVAPAAPVVSTPAAASPVYFYRNGTLYYQSPARVYSTAPAVRSSTNTTGAMTGRISHNFDPTGRGITLHKPWLKPLRP